MVAIPKIVGVMSWDQRKLVSTNRQQPKTSFCHCIDGVVPLSWIVIAGSFIRCAE